MSEPTNLRQERVLRHVWDRYEVQGEYVIPSSATIPRSAADMALVQGSAAAQDPNTTSLAPFETGGGRWRLQVSPGCTLMLIRALGANLQASNDCHMSHRNIKAHQANVFASNDSQTSSLIMNCTERASGKCAKK